MANISTKHIILIMSILGLNVMAVTLAR